MQQPQNYIVKNNEIKSRFLKLLSDCPEIKSEKIKFSWSNWGFGVEDFTLGCKRLYRAGIPYIELHGNHYGKELGYKVQEIKPVLEEYGLKTSGVCGMFSPECDLSSPSGIIRQQAIDYLKREIEFTAEMGGAYLLVVPAAVGRPEAYDESEVIRSIETLGRVADLFVQYGIRGAIEPIRSAETSIVHTVKEAVSYIEQLGHAGVNWINGDVYHMQSEESHIGSAVLEVGDRLINLHLADSNRGALGQGSMDIDCIIMALYLINYEQGEHFVTPEPLGPGGNPYPAMHGITDGQMLDDMVFQSYRYFREREQAVKEN